MWWREWKNLEFWGDLNMGLYSLTFFSQRKLLRIKSDVNWCCRAAAVSLCVSRANVGRHTVTGACVLPCPYSRFSWAGWRLILHRIKDVSALKAGVRSGKGRVTGGDWAVTGYGTAQEKENPRRGSYPLARFHNSQDPLQATASGGGAHAC
jgi:hypothetical protein